MRVVFAYLNNRNLIISQKKRTQCTPSLVTFFKEISIHSTIIRFYLSFYKFIIIEWFPIKLLFIKSITSLHTALYASINLLPLVIKDITLKSNFKHQNIWNTCSFKKSFILNGLIPSLNLYLISNVYQTLIICWYVHYLYHLDVCISEINSK